MRSSIRRMMARGYRELEKQTLRNDPREAVRHRAGVSPDVCVDRRSSLEIPLLANGEAPLDLPTIRSDEAEHARSAAASSGFAAKRQQESGVASLFGDPGEHLALSRSPLESLVLFELRCRISRKLPSVVPPSVVPPPVEGEGERDYEKRLQVTERLKQVVAPPSEAERRHLHLQLTEERLERCLDAELNLPPMAQTETAEDFRERLRASHESGRVVSPRTEAETAADFWARCQTTCERAREALLTRR